MTKYVKLLLTLNIGFFILLLILGTKGLNLNGLMALYPVGSRYFDYYQFVTYMFAHGSFSHILINMLVLFSVGPKLEEKFGSDRFLNFYLITGIVGGLSHIFLYNTPVIGASAAVWGILATYAIIYPNERLYFWFILPIKSIYLVGVLFFYEIISIFTSDGISHVGHVAGGLTGLIFYYSLNKSKKIN